MNKVIDSRKGGFENRIRPRQLLDTLTLIKVNSVIACGCLVQDCKARINDSLSSDSPTVEIVNSIVTE